MHYRPIHVSPRKNRLPNEYVGAINLSITVTEHVPDTLALGEQFPDVNRKSDWYTARQAVVA